MSGATTNPLERQPGHVLQCDGTTNPVPKYGTEPKASTRESAEDRRIVQDRHLVRPQKMASQVLTLLSEINQ